MRSPRAADGHLCQLCLAVYTTQLSVRIFPALNLGYDEWPNFLGNRPMVEALLRRLRHQCHTVRIDGPSLCQLQG